MGYLGPWAVVSVDAPLTWCSHTHRWRANEALAAQECTTPHKMTNYIGVAWIMIYVEPPLVWFAELRLQKVDSVLSAWSFS